MLKKPKCVLSYSGGKDSTLALFHMLQTAEPVALIAMLEEQGQRARSHGMDTTLIAVRTSTSSSSAAQLRGFVVALYIRFTSLEGALVVLLFPLPNGGENGV